MSGKNKQKLIDNVGGQSTQLAGKQRSGRSALEGQIWYWGVLLSV